MEVFPVEAQREITRLRNEVHAKDETLNQLKLKTKSFVDNLRCELAGEKKKVGDLEEQLMQTKDSSTSASNPTSGGNEELERLKKEIATLTHHDHEFKTRAKMFADNMKAQLQAEKSKTMQMEKELEEKTAALAAAAATTSVSSSSFDLLGGFEEPSHLAKKHEEEIAALQSQLQRAQHEATAAKDQLLQAEDRAKQHAQELVQTTQALESLKVASGEQIVRLEDEIKQAHRHEHALEDTVQSHRSVEMHEHSQLEAALRRTQELMDQLQQFKIENEYLQKQLQDKDFLLEQMDANRLRADENEAKANALRGEIAALSTQMAAKEQAACAKCDELKREVSEMATLYEKVNMGRSQSDLQLAEAQTALTALQSVKQSYETAQARMEDIAKENMQLNEKVFQKESEVNMLKGDIQRLTGELSQLNQTLSSSKSDSFTRKQQSEALEADKKKAEDALRAALGKAAALEKKNQELTASVEAVTKDSSEKRQKAKVLVVSLTNEKQSLVDAKAELQREVDRLRMELNQKDVENKRRLKQMQEETTQRIAQSATSAQSLGDEIATLKQTLMLVQESERNQQRAKELANAKREVEDSKKKRLAAKAETQKLAVELENMQKTLAQLADGAATTCTSNVKKMNHLQDRVHEALQVLEKRASASGKNKNGASSRNMEVEDLRGAESTRPLSPTSGARKVDDNIAHVTETLAVLIEVTDKLCDLSIEQNDVNLKDVVVDKFSQLFTQCFSEKVRAAYSKVEDAAESLGGKS